MYSDVFGLQAVFIQSEAG